jgi:enoyl-CoA hydratase
VTIESEREGVSNNEPTVRAAVECRDGVKIGQLTVDNPRPLNVLNSPLLECFSHGIDSLAAEDDLRLVVLQGAGERAFIGGADIAEMVGFDQVAAETFIRSLHGVCARLRALPVPVVARIHGYCLGAGLEVAAACDLRVASEESRFGMPEVQVGIPSVIEAALLPRLIGWGRTSELLFTGRMIDADQAQRWGLVERVVPSAELDAAVAEWTASIVSAGPRAIRLQKALLREWERLPLEQAIEAGIRSFVSAYESDEPRLAMQRFLDGRKR